MVSNGAKQSLTQAVLAVCSPGDEVSKRGLVYASRISIRRTTYVVLLFGFHMNR